MENYIFEAEAKSKSEAEEYTLKTLRLNADEVRFETVDSGKGGFFGISQKKPAIVRAYVTSRDLPAEKIIHGVVLTVLKKMGIEAEVVGMGDVDGKIYVEVASRESGLVIGKRGSTLDALQFILNLMVDSKIRHGRKIVLDIESYRDKRELSLVRLGKSVAVTVAKTGKSKLLEPMNPFERRIIHMALQENEKVFTRSEGNGTYKKVRVIPMKDKHKYKDIVEKGPNNDLLEEVNFE
ncbi:MULTISPECIES: RNA-binding cell elongation regulator Jag/EloR [Leptospira]|nr:MULTISPECIES: RNA-binding cell elongation regulator Jag/EloR [Leptospira]EKP13178.1 R3H domain protein [Leptospira borgpetersenii str. 200801926]EMK09327.1 R3H domain protein [Leptospira sp. serovar Kenya str. Sh9]EMN13694.1 R3H domain protein [Leptospira borgpetersenii str. Brem 307]EMN17537.1 R3H domain protein [Leptospira borgpetersenii str. Brem 328]EMN59321.1 R3H domain protein [Leptospira borgpetersenii serovar Javanica str. MK146]